ncbi:DUF2142 domain-containing protein [Arthrobacter sp. PAMC25564]|uniref:DUF2142 domain-containing protein n=1 Tax=Arthrobacter sp. PAMC25564 TaxID=2565366 RepID=UPI0010A214E5|nr:DUF2142 domain-containing protein [Arthrobacter sp. PAMC25564]QCB96959.1 DUF2142 domain-containing protein [Arthrobacter sp. PAMC25564]
MANLQTPKIRRSSMSEQSTPRTVSGAEGQRASTGASRPKALYLRLFLFFAVLGTLWAVATPLMAYPDEPSHTIRAAAVVRGQIAVEPGQSFGNGVHVQVPAYIANLEAQKCFAFYRERTANCAPAIPAGDNFDAIGVTSAGTYNPMYYWFVGLPSLVMSGAPAIYAMRIVSVLASALFYAAAFMALTRLRRPKWPIVAASLAITPMALFLASGINPNSIEIPTTMAAFCALLAVLDNSGRLRQVLPAIATVGAATAVLANTRSVSLVWLLCGVVTACLFFRWGSVKRLFVNRYVLVTVGLAAIGVALGLLWIVVSMNAPASTGTAPEGIANPAPNVAPYQAFVTMLDRTFDFIPQYIGVTGWLDTPVPQGVVAFWSMLFVATFLLPVLARPRRLFWGMLVALLALAVVPALLQASLISTVGFFWQGRYSMPLVLIAFVSAGMAWRTHHFPSGQRSRAIGRVLMLAVVVAHVSSFLYILRRYVVGIIDISTWQTMISHPSWQPPLGWFVLTALYTVVLLWAAQRLYTYLFPGHSLLRLPAKLARRLPGQPANA